MCAAVAYHGFLPALIVKFTTFSPNLIAPSTYHHASSCQTTEITSLWLLFASIAHNLHNTIWRVWIHLVRFISCRTLIQTLPLCNAYIAAFKPPVCLNLILIDKMKIARPRSIPFVPPSTWLPHLVPDWYCDFFLCVQTTLCHFGRITPQYHPQQVTSSRSVEIGSLLSVCWALQFPDIWWYYPPIIYHPHLLDPINPPHSPSWPPGVSYSRHVRPGIGT